MLTKSNMATWNKGSWVALPTAEGGGATDCSQYEHVHEDGPLILSVLVLVALKLLRQP